MVGVDIIAIDRIEKAVTNERFESEVFTASEINYCTSARSYAGVYAAKEALVKALGTGLTRACFHQIEVTHDDNGAPHYNLSGTVAQNVNGRATSLSISHDGEYAIAVCQIGDVAESIDIASAHNDKPFSKIITAADAKLPKRASNSHKGSYGKVLIIGGSDTMTGAPHLAYQSAVAAHRSGAGLVSLCVPYSLRAAYQARVMEQTLRFMPDCDGKMLFDRYELDDFMRTYGAIVIGPGMGKSSEVADIVTYLATYYSGTLVVDADALNSIADNVSAIKNHRCKLILTPHIGELLRLDCNALSGSIETNVMELAREYNCVLVAKNDVTTVSDGKDIYLNTTGTPAMAKGGSGDVLAGMIGALACVLSPLSAAIAAVYHFGKAGERAQKRLNSETSVLASDIIIELND